MHSPILYTEGDNGALKRVENVVLGRFIAKELLTLCVPKMLGLLFNFRRAVRAL